MSRRRWLDLVVCAFVLFLSAPPAVAGPVLTDPTGDTFGVGAVQQDITTYSAVTNPSGPSTTFTVNFASPIAPPSASAPNSLVGYIDIDTDRNPATGGTGTFGSLTGGNNWINFFIPPNPGSPSIPPPNDTLIALGDEFFVDLFSEALNPGFVDIIDANTNTLFTTVSITFTAQGFSVTVPLAGTVPDFSLNFGLLVGTFDELTDRAPNGESPAQSFVPEPAGFFLFGVCCFGVLGWVGRRLCPSKPDGRG